MTKSKWIMYIESEAIDSQLTGNSYREFELDLPPDFNPMTHNDIDNAVDYVMGVIGKEFSKLLKSINPDVLNWFVYRDIWVWNAHLEIATEKGKYEDRLDEVLNGFICDLLQVRMVRYKDRYEILKTVYLVETYPDFAEAIKANTEGQLTPAGLKATEDLENQYEKGTPEYQRLVEGKWLDDEDDQKPKSPEKED